MQSDTNKTDMRTHDWLCERLELVLETWFRDLPPGYPIDIQFGQRALTRFGSIRARNGRSLILMNALFALDEVPAFVVDATIAHELAHYVHGFGSGLPKRYTHPHKGNVIGIELAGRGCGELEARSDIWLRTNWERVFDSHAGDLSHARHGKHGSAISTWQTWLLDPNRRSKEWLEMHAKVIARRFGLEKTPFEIDWHPAGTRQTAISYRMRTDKSVRIHGLLAHSDTPIEVALYEIAYWTAASCVGNTWPKVENAMRVSGTISYSEKAQHWKRYSWKRFITKHHPLI